MNKSIKVFETIEQAGHEQVLFCHDRESGLKAIIAIHNTSLGPAMGATRLWPYANEEDALQDVLRLSRGMTYKAACANIPAGGGKGVIIANTENKTDALLQAYGRFVESLKGRFITGQDVNISLQDIRTMGRETNYIVGASESSGGPTIVTAIGVISGIQAAVKYKLDKQNLNGIKVAIQGVGNVGKNLCRLLYEQGANIFVTDMKEDRLEEVKRLYGATIVDLDEIYSLDVDVFAPCALGGVINSSTILRLKAPIVAGAANNQLEDENETSKILFDKNILYCPDYVINAGGLINVYNEMIGYNEKQVTKMVFEIYNNLLYIFQKSESYGISTQEASKEIAEERILKARKRRSNI